ncbi:unnamed protein product [Paramecium sonneborni]|uniref:Uncharacterized protein n=1 Tax=Paramecium sonneborni TaxID=65129 RepID=A0A8S1RX40_9CILI|nr:unnamed protein product [Paramecium sonneborni]
MVEYLFQGFDNQIIQFNDYDTITTFQNIVQNNQFIIHQFTDTILINKMLRNYEYWFNKTSNSLLYFNSHNQLQLYCYSIQFISLEVNLTNQEKAGNNYTFSIMCIIIGINGIRQNYTKANFFMQFLTKNDKNIYMQCLINT